ncbi:MAG: hypothetical protein Q8Q01_05070 [archaeon]|nr:hypothetical protein [archaeon]
MLELRLGKPLIVVTTERYPDYPQTNKHYVGILGHYGRNSLTLKPWNDRVFTYRNHKTGEERLGLDIFPKNLGDLTIQRARILQFYHPLDEKKLVLVATRREPQYKSLPKPDESPIKAYALPDPETGMKVLKLGEFRKDDTPRIDNQKSQSEQSSGVFFNLSLDQYRSRTAGYDTQARNQPEVYQFLLESVVDEALREAELEGCVREFLRE